MARSEKDGPSLYAPGRPNGSLYSRQKRAIADGVEYMRLHATKERKAVIFCLTSPGLTDQANAPKFISRFIDNMKSNYGMGNYVWVRELTTKGFPHFHFIAEWNTREWFLSKNTEGLTRAEELSKYWSSLFGESAGNSIRFGSYPKHNKRTWYVTSPRQAWYLCKYIGKTFGKALNSTEEPTPKTARYRKFGMSEDLAMVSQPKLFYSSQVVDRIRKVVTAVKVKRKDLGHDHNFTFHEKHYTDIVRADDYRDRWKETYVDVDVHRRIWCDSDGVELEDVALKEYDWKWTSHGQTYIGMNKRRSA